jgi:hypothetical protein
VIVILAWAAAQTLARLAYGTEVDCETDDPTATKEGLYFWAIAGQGVVFAASVAGAFASWRRPGMLLFIGFAFSAFASAVFAVFDLYGAFVASLGCYE